MESGIIDFQPLVPPNHIADANSCRGFPIPRICFHLYHDVPRFRGCLLSGRGADRQFGNVNTTVVGDYFHPKTRLPGAGGAPDFLSYARRTILTMRGGDFVNVLDYFTSPGFSGWRRQS